MFLPVLLVRDYGIWGFLVFADPERPRSGGDGVGLRDARSVSKSSRRIASHVACSSLRPRSHFTFFFIVDLMKPHFEILSD